MEPLDDDMYPELGYPMELRIARGNGTYYDLQNRVEKRGKTYRFEGRVYTDESSLFRTLLEWETRYAVVPEEAREVRSGIAPSEPEGAFKRLKGWQRLNDLQVWVERDYAPATGRLPRELNDLLRLDVFGNVVSIYALPGSVCYFRSEDGLTTNDRSKSISIMHACAASTTCSLCPEGGAHRSTT
jgi:hypothetical protein